MVWSPVDPSGVCAGNTSLSGCAPSYLAFMSFVAHHFGQSNDNYDSNKGPRSNPEAFDFIIVGAGSAGCVLANRLSEIGKWRILLLEAGTEEPLVADVPAFGLMIRNTNIDWNYRTQPEKRSCRSKMGQSCGWSRGKVMGGCSTLNYLMYIRAQPRDYDTWESMGNPGWSYNDVLPYFKKSENNLSPEIVKANPEYHNVGGYLTVEHFPYDDPNTNVLLEAWQEIGYKNIDANANEHIGSLKVQSTTKNGQRQSTNAAFIRPVIKNRPNLVVRTQAYVTKILIGSLTNEAIGVDYFMTNSNWRDKGKKRAFARKEVIVAGGSINSPKLLMLSGIGPRKDLEKLGIRVFEDLAVGKNLHDHPTIDGLIIKLSKTATLDGFKNAKNDSLEYLKTQNNAISAMGVLSAVSFVKTMFEEIPDYPDMQFTFDGINKSDVLALAEQTPGMAALPLAYYDAVNIRPVLLAPRSRGVLKLNSTDPIYGPPLLYPNYFDVDEDLDRIVAGIRIAQRLFNTEAFRANGFSFYEKKLPSCEQYEFDSDQYWRCVAMEYTNTIYHFVGTCKMGPRSDPDAVVDNELRVHGVKRLRVVDASIMPIVTRGNTNAPTIMMAEKISDIIKKVYLKNRKSR